jgi:hypothetical protein
MSLNNINWFIFVMEVQWIYCEAENWSLNINLLKCKSINWDFLTTDIKTIASSAMGYSWQKQRSPF